MGSKAPVLFLVLAVVALLAAAPTEPAVSPPAAPAPTPNCDSVLMDKLASCLSFVLNGSTDKVPEKDCCKGLGTVLKEDLFCICQLASNPDVANSRATQFGVDPNRVRMLPQACKTRIPADKCAKIGLPLKTPVGSATAGPAPASAPTAGGPVAGAGAATGGNAPAPSSRATRLSTAVTSSAWALLLAVGLPVLALAATSVRV